MYLSSADVIFTAAMMDIDTDLNTSPAKARYAPSLSNHSVPSVLIRHSTKS